MAMFLKQRFCQICEEVLHNRKKNAKFCLDCAGEKRKAQSSMHQKELYRKKKLIKISMND